MPSNHIQCQFMPLAHAEAPARGHHAACLANRLTVPCNRQAVCLTAKEAQTEKPGQRGPARLPYCPDFTLVHARVTTRWIFGG